MTLQQQHADLVVAPAYTSPKIWQVYSRNREDWSESHQKIVEMLEDLEAKSASIVQLDELCARVHRVDEQVRELDLSVSLKEDVSNLGDDLRSADELMGLEQEEIQDSITSLREEVSDLLALVASQSTALEACEESLAEQISAADESRVALDVDLRGEIDAAEQRIAELEAAAAESKVILDVVASDEELSAAKEELESKIEELSSAYESDALSERIDTLSSESSESDDELRAEVEALREELASSKEEASESQADLKAELASSIAEVESNDDRLDDLEDNYKRLLAASEDENENLAEQNSDLADRVYSLERIMMDMKAAVEGGAHTALIEAHLPPIADENLFTSNDGHAQAFHDTTVFRADDAGTDGNSISLVFSGANDLDTVVNAWNGANPTNTASHSGVGTFVPAAATVNLANGR